MGGVISCEFPSHIVNGMLLTGPRRKSIERCTETSPDNLTVKPKKEHKEKSHLLITRRAGEVYLTELSLPDTICPCLNNEIE